MENSKSKIKEVQVSFVKEDNLWYFDFPNYPFAKHNLLMVNGSDKLLDYLSEGHKNISMTVYFTNEEPEEHDTTTTMLLSRTRGGYFGGYYYDVDPCDPIPEAYFCPVMLFKYGNYPKYIIIDKTSIINKN